VPWLLFARYEMEKKTPRVAGPTGTALHERWLLTCVCNSLRQTQRRCWLQMAGCGLGCAMMAIAASHPRSPHGTAVRMVHFTTTRSFYSTEGMRHAAMRCRCPYDCEDRCANLDMAKKASVRSPMSRRVWQEAIWSVRRLGDDWTGGCRLRVRAY
jgi:hypothetical protein